MMFACLYRPPQSNRLDDSRRVAFGELVDAPPRGRTLAAAELNDLVAIAHGCSPRYELHSPDLVVIDVAGLERLFGPSYVIADELRRAAVDRHLRVHIAVASTQTAAMILARTRPGVTVVEAGAEAAALAAISITAIQSSEFRVLSSAFDVRLFERWGVKTLGDLAALPAADLASRLGRPALAWQAMARGADARPLIPSLDEERFESTLELEWPIEGLEPLSFVLTRLLEPLSTRLERRDRGVAVLHVLLGLVTRERHARRLELPTPMREVRALRTLALLDLEARPAEAAIDRVTIVIDPTPGRVVQHTLYTRAQPTPEQLSTLVARLGALMGQDRFGAPARVDSDRPGAFAMTPFKTDHHDQRRTRGTRGERSLEDSAVSARSALNVVSALRRCRQPVPARVAVADGRPVRVTTDRRGFTGGAVTHCAGPWRTSGQWWASEKLEVKSQKSEVQVRISNFERRTSGAAGAGVRLHLQRSLAGLAPEHEREIVGGHGDDLGGVDEAQVASHCEGMGVVGAISVRHLLVLRLVSRVTFGCGGSPGGVPPPLPPYSSAKPKALWPISWMAISLA
jgi:protein ImuB